MAGDGTFTPTFTIMDLQEEGFKMKIINDTIILENPPEFYKPESTGYKNNAFKTLKSIEEDGYTLDDLQSCKIIIVRNSETERQIEREISNISVFEGVVIISWFNP